MYRISVFAAALMALSGCADGCVNDVVTSAEAPDGRHVPVIFQRDCGATTGLSTQVSVLKKGDELSGGGNAFRADTDHGAAVAGNWGGPWAELVWTAPDHLLIRYAAKSRLFEQDSQVSGVKISYQQVTR